MIDLFNTWEVFQGSFEWTMLNYREFHQSLVFYQENTSCNGMVLFAHSSFLGNGLKWTVCKVAFLHDCPEQELIQWQLCSSNFKNIVLYYYYPIFEYI